METQTQPLDHEFFNVQWPSGRAWQVVGFGLNAVDWICTVPSYPEHNTKMRFKSLIQLGGGQVATAMSLCARYGLQVRYVGRVGDDPVGQFSMESLSKEPMDLSGVEMISGSGSQLSIILVDEPTGERTIIWDRDDRLIYGPADVPRDIIVSAQLLHVDGHDEDASIQAALWAREAGMKICLDVDKIQPRVEELLRLCDFAIPTIGFLQRFTGQLDWREALLHVDRITPGFTAVTLGKDGCAAVWQGEIYEIPGFSITSVDATGAGDVFHGAFIYGLFHNWSVHKILRFSNAAGALSCTRIGARGGIPTLEEIDRILQTRQG